MRALMVVEADPVADGARCVLDAVEALAVNALLFQRPDHAFDHAVLLRAVRRDELLLQAVAANQGGVFPAGKNQAVIAAQQELFVDLAQGAEPVDQGVFEGAGGCRGLARG